MVDDKCIDSSHPLKLKMGGKYISKNGQIQTFAVVFSILFFLCGGTAYAGIFKWVDKNGKTHFTNDLAKIPRQYRQSDKFKSIRSSAAGSRKVLKAEESKEEEPASKKGDEQVGKPEILPAGQDSEADMPQEQKPPVDKEILVKIGEINKAVEYLEIDCTRLKGLLKEYKKQDRIGGEYIAWSNKRAAQRSKELAEHLYSSEIPELEPLVYFLWERIEATENLKIEASEEFEKHVPALFKGVKKDLAIQQKMLEDLKRSVEKLGGKP